MTREPLRMSVGSTEPGAARSPLQSTGCRSEEGGASLTTTPPPFEKFSLL